MCSSHWSSRTCPKGLGVVLRLRHRNFDGSSHFAALLGIRHLAMRPQETKLCRTIAHVFDFGVKPLPLHELDVAVRSATGLMLDDVLHPHDLFCEVIH
jgi:hypothetical protein